MNSDAASVPGHSAWQPGLQSDIPASLWPLVTLFRPENALVDYSVARELADLTGLKVLDLAAIRPERLVVHVLLVRVTADLSVPDGPNYEVLGINLRGMVDRIYQQHMLPQMDRIVGFFDTEKEKVSRYVAEQLALRVFDRSQLDSPDAQSATSSPSFLSRLFTPLLGHRGIAGPAQTASQSRATATPDEPREIIAIRQWKAQLQQCDDRLERACLESLVKTVDTMVAHRGRLVPDAGLIRDIVVNQVSNDYGATCLEEYIEPLWQEAIVAEGYRLLPAQNKPVVMNVKGASASGKSTIRPQQRRLAGKLGIPWEDFALISPDYWRKYLLDYGSLGDAYHYGAMLTGRELELVDQKLDRYMADKASRGATPHMLIDRFRFDSFNAGIDDGADSKLLSRFGDYVYLFFMITHPAATVERAWLRGIRTGRYKAVDDLLYHNVEAFTGMPSLFLSWVNSRDKQVHFEFLDNNVELGELPRTAAFGWNNNLTILDVSVLVNVDRYRKVNIAAREPGQVLADNHDHDDGDKGFISRCAERVPTILFADQASACVYAKVVGGRLIWWDADYLHAHADDADLMNTLQQLGFTDGPCPMDTVDIPAGVPAGIPAEIRPEIDIAAETRVTVGQWYQGD